MDLEKDFNQKKKKILSICGASTPQTEEINTTHTNDNTNTCLQFTCEELVYGISGLV